MKGFSILAVLFFLLAPVICRGDDGKKAASANQGTEISVSLQDLKVFPNPVQNKWFTIETGADKIREIRISNIAGTLVYSKILEVPAEKSQVFTDNLPNGIYLLKVFSENHTSRTVKLLISGR